MLRGARKPSVNSDTDHSKTPAASPIGMSFVAHLLLQLHSSMATVFVASKASENELESYFTSMAVSAVLCEL